MTIAEAAQPRRHPEGSIAQGVISALIEHGHGDEVRRLGAEGDWGCASVWASAAAERGDIDAALALLEPFAATGWWPAVVARNQVAADAEARAAAAAVSSSADLRTLDRRAADDPGPGRQDDDAQAQLRYFLAGTWPGGLDATADTRLDHLITRLLGKGRAADVRKLLTEPGSQHIASRYAAHLEQHGDRAAALDVLAAYATASAPRLLDEYAAMLMRADRTEEAVTFLHAAALDEGAHPHLALPTLVSMTADCSLADRVLAIIQEIADQNDGMSLALQEQRAGVLALHGDVDQALAELTDPDDAPWLTVRQLARILANLDHLDEAIAVLATVDDPGAAIERAILLVRQSRVAEAITVARVSRPHAKPQSG
ncbi:MAG: hypothetical protein HOV87_29610 [Catenulispora sp.]|nr:hypothetical protein [Catenulispora sp.]